MASFKINVNIPEIRDALASIEKYDTVSRARIGGCIQMSAINIASGAARRVSNKDGELQGSIKSKFDLQKLTGTITAKKFYAPFVEFGHQGVYEVPKGKKALLIGGHFYSHATPPKVEAHPFLRPAYEDEKPNLVASIAKVIGEAP
jgi:hypothetical protein